MNSRERIFAALNHEEPDCIPYDLGGTHVTSIHVVAYRRLCAALGIDPEPVAFSDIVQQTVVPCDALMERFGVDTRGLFPGCSHNRGFENTTETEDAYEHVDEWGFTQRLAKKGGFWWSQVGFPIDGITADPKALAAYRWPVADDPSRIEGLRVLAREYRDAGKIVMCKSLCAGMFEMGQRFRRMDNFLCDLLADPKTAEMLMDGILELKKRYWAMVLGELGDLIDIVVENDDYGTQESQLISLRTYQTLIRPRLEDLFRFIRETHAEKRAGGERGYLFFHSCGNVRPYLPGFIEMGVDILNPVHVTADGMSPEDLKRDFGDAITFWGGGVETQNILSRGTPEEVRDNVRRNVDALAPGGGFVFNTIHNIQAEVPPENILAMWEEVWGNVEG